VFGIAVADWDGDGREDLFLSQNFFGHNHGLTRDDAGMSYSYTVTSGLPLAEHEASFRVEPRGTGSRIVWHTHAVNTDPSVDMEERLADRQREALEGLRALLDD
jgi:hypothetical protein